MTQSLADGRWPLAEESAVASANGKRQTAYDVERIRRDFPILHRTIRGGKKRIAFSDGRTIEVEAGFFVWCMPGDANQAPSPLSRRISWLL